MHFSVHIYPFKSNEKWNKHEKSPPKFSNVREIGMVFCSWLYHNNCLTPFDAISKSCIFTIKLTPKDWSILHIEGKATCVSGAFLIHSELDFIYCFTWFYNFWVKFFCHYFVFLWVSPFFFFFHPFIQLLVVKPSDPPEAFHTFTWILELNLILPFYFFFYIIWPPFSLPSYFLFCFFPCWRGIWSVFLPTVTSPFLFTPLKHQGSASQVWPVSTFRHASYVYIIVVALRYCNVASMSWLSIAKASQLS